MQSPIKSRRPEDAELSRKREELADLQARLAELELQLLTLRLELTEFEALYHGKMGPLYAELDEVEALIAERLAKLRPLDMGQRNPPRMPENEPTLLSSYCMHQRTLPSPVLRSQTLKDLYRAAAKQLHPDLARDDYDRATPVSA